MIFNLVYIVTNTELIECLVFYAVSEIVPPSYGGFTPTLNLLTLLALSSPTVVSSNLWPSLSFPEHSSSVLLSMVRLPITWETIKEVTSLRRYSGEVTDNLF